MESKDSRCSTDVSTICNPAITILCVYHNLFMNLSCLTGEVDRKRNHEATFNFFEKLQDLKIIEYNLGIKSFRNQIQILLWQPGLCIALKHAIFDPE